MLVISELSIFNISFVCDKNSNVVQNYLKLCIYANKMLKMYFLCKKKEMQFLNCISNFVRRMRLELTRPCDHYPLKVACIPISPPAQGLLNLLSGKRDSNPRPQPWQGCALPTELFPQISLKFARFLLRSA